MTKIDKEQRTPIDEIHTFGVIAVDKIIGKTLGEFLETDNDKKDRYRLEDTGCLGFQIFLVGQRLFVRMRIMASEANRSKENCG